MVFQVGRGDLTLWLEVPTITHTGLDT
jgi:hypothetical protein